MRKVDQAHFTLLWAVVIFLAVLGVIKSIGHMNRLLATILVILFALFSFVAASLIYPHFYAANGEPRRRTVRISALSTKMVGVVGKGFCSMGAHTWHDTYDTTLRMRVKKCYSCGRVKSPVASSLQRWKP